MTSLRWPARAGSLWFLLLLSGCASPGLQGSAARLLEQYRQAAEQDRPEEAYALLSTQQQARLSPVSFAQKWRAMRRELQQQARDLRARPAPAVRIRATASYAAQERILLGLQGSVWQVEDGFPLSACARTPLQAAQRFLLLVQEENEALARQLLSALLLREGELTFRRLRKLKARLSRDRARAVDGESLSLDLVQEGDYWKVSGFR